MKAKELAPIFKQLLEVLPGFAFHKRLLLRAPVSQVLQGIFFDSSSFDARIMLIEVFLMPFCVPKDDVVFTFGFRLRHNGRERWSADTPNLVENLATAIREQALPFLSRGETLLGFVDVASTSSFENPHVPKNIAYALARAGESARAISVIDATLPTMKRSRDWEQTIFEELTTLRGLLIENPDEAMRRLAAWEGETIKSLGLERFV